MIFALVVLSISPQDKWVDRSSVELVMDTRKRRNIKLDELGI